MGSGPAPCITLGGRRTACTMWPEAPCSPTGITPRASSRAQRSTLSWPASTYFMTSRVASSV